MTDRERVIAAIRHHDTEITPYQVKFTREAYENMAAYYQDANFIENIGNHMALIDAKPPKTPVREGYIRDEFGVVWNRTVDKDIGIVDSHPLDDSHITSFPFPDLARTGLRERVQAGLQAHPDQFCYVNIGHGLFERAWILYGMEALLTDMLLRPSLIHNLLDRLTEYYLRTIDALAAFPQLDGIYYGDDWGQQRGLIMGPKLWRIFIKPRITLIHRRIKAIGKFVYVHTCGDIETILPDMIETGIDLYDPFQPEVFDIFRIKKEYGRDIAFLGGISLQKTLPFGSARDVRRETRLKADRLSEGGGYIAGPSHALTRDVPAENIHAMLETLRKPRKNA